MSEIGTLLRFPGSEAPEAGDHCSYSGAVGRDFIGSTLVSASEGGVDDDETSLDGICPMGYPSVLNEGTMHGEG